ncbi:HAD family phosphatase [Galbibacter sp. EGI 63066]|uniref:HAD family hydrolase n=1 Tax=Galbibacter sp. EGI 63066 TaxID=2993559 RepID=UPI00224909BB|nr:HAD family phosphatase [Galbibacter sp. EGI 63066]MCX2679608.1 HAD family phosphatase [Galbibacter sp. EGI 63066]
MIKDHFIFDMDGVLVDSEPVHQQILNKVFDELNLEFSVDYHHTLVGMAAVPMWGKIRNDFGISIDANELVSFHKEMFFAETENIKVPPVNGVLDFLKRLETLNFNISLASSSPVKLINRFVDELAVRSSFDYLVSGEEVGRSKPFPDIFFKVSEKYNVDPSRFLVIEDSHNGVKAAKAAGMTCIGYQNPNSGNQDLSAADYIVNDFSDMDIQKIKEIAS